MQVDCSSTTNQQNKNKQKKETAHHWGKLMSQREILLFHLLKRTEETLQLHLEQSSHKPTGCGRSPISGAEMISTHHTLVLPVPCSEVCLCGWVLTSEMWDRPEISHKHMTFPTISLWGCLELWDDRGKAWKSIHENWKEKLLLSKATRTWRS